MVVGLRLLGRATRPKLRQDWSYWSCRMGNNQWQLAGVLLLQGTWDGSAVRQSLSKQQTTVQASRSSTCCVTWMVWPEGPNAQGFMN